MPDHEVRYSTLSHQRSWPDMPMFCIKDDFEPILGYPILESVTWITEEDFYDD